MEAINYSSRRTNPREKASIVSKIFFWWTYHEIKRGQDKLYTSDDLPATLRDDQSHILGNKLEKLWFQELESSKLKESKPSLLRVLCKMFWKDFVKIAILHSFNEHIISIGRQILLGLFLSYLRHTATNRDAYYHLVIVGILLVTFNGSNSVLSNHFLSRSARLGCQIKIALSSLIYRKCLRLKTHSSDNTSVGYIVNLLSNDMRQLDHIVMFSNYLWSGGCSTIIILIIVIHCIGVLPATACTAVILIAMPIQVLVSKALARNRIKTAYASDKRIQIMDEIVCGIQVIKMYAWEKPYEELVNLLRRAEMKLIRKNLYLRGFQVACAALFSRCALYTLVTVYAMLGGEILPEKVFVLVGLCGIMGKVACGLAFRSFAEVMQSKITVKRVQHFLELGEFQKPSAAKEDNDDNIINFINVKANWILDSTRDTLKDINMTAKKGELVTIIGQVGSGKSSLLNVMLGELSISGGIYEIRGNVSYYSQVPWIFSGTIRQNILFSEIFEPSRYERVIEVCALKEDFKILPHADHTTIGERGITLSGGQKARIALARTIYKRADVYLLDDPLSAVDVNVSKKIFGECILGFLKDTTRILVTHQLQLLNDSDKIILLHEGTIEAQGKLEEIMTLKADYLHVLQKTFLQNKADKNEHKDVPVEEKENALYESQSIYESGGKMQKDEAEEKLGSDAVTMFFMQGISVKGIVVLLILFLVTQTAVNGCEIWLSLWTYYTVSRKANHSPNEHTWRYIPWLDNPRRFFIIGYTILILCVIALVIIRNCSFAYCGQKCSKKIHDIAFQGVINTNSSFFHCNPTGKILNRFSKDLGVVDSQLLISLLDALASFYQVSAAFVITSFIHLWYMAPALIVVSALLLVRRFYLRTSIMLKNLENTTKSPVFVHVHSTMQGLPIVRACGASNVLIEQFDTHQDLHTSAWTLYTYSSFGYACCLEIITLLYMVVVVIGCFYLDLTSSQVGLALVQMTILMSYIQWAMIQAAEVSNQATSIDRLLNYSSLPPEHQPPKNNYVLEKWPSEGKISFENVSLRYGVASAASIYDVSFVIEPCQKIGIVGRTGAGKTSLTAALFRLGIVQGSIKIDGLDTSTITLEKLRSSISVIPQDPVLFSGTIRKNLDPFGEFDDSTLWDALSQAELKNTISTTQTAGLDSLVSEGGKNFSVGERQLICLARAVLRNNKILVLDEATANVDQQTDSIIQKAIRYHFKNCTVLTIAHRLNAVVDADRVLVMDSGTVVEYDHPYKLLLNQESYFYKLVSKTGEFVAAALIGVARENYNHRMRNENDEELNKKLS